MSAQAEGVKKMGAKMKKEIVKKRPICPFFWVEKVDKWDVFLHLLLQAIYNTVPLKINRSLNSFVGHG